MTGQFHGHTPNNREFTRRREHLTFRGNVRSGRHGWLRLTPAYSLHVVKEILQASPKDGMVLDPFSGTGTTPLVATSIGLRAHAFDINPFLVWLGDLKLRKYPHGTSKALQAAAGEIAASLRRQNRWTRVWTPDLHQIEKWWDPPVLDALSQLFSRICQYGEEHPEVVSAQLLKIAFCRAMIENSHASFSHQSMSFKKQDAKPQPQLFSPPSGHEPVLRSFNAAVDEVATAIEVDQPLALGVVRLGDSRCLPQSVDETRYMTVVTSPPYPNRMSYIRELRPYMYWLGYLTNGRAAGELDWQAIGGTWGCATSNLSTWSAANPEVPYPGFDRIVRAISDDHPLLGRYVHKYFVDIREHLLSLRGVLATGARCHYIVGNSKFYGTLLPVEQIYAALFEDTGFKDARVVVLRKRNSKKELFEYVVSAEAR